MNKNIILRLYNINTLSKLFQRNLAAKFTGGKLGGGVSSKKKNN